MPRKVELSSPKRLKQKTLLGFLNSSPVRVSQAAPMPQTPKHLKPKARKRQRVASFESDHDDAAGSEDSDVNAVHFEPEDLYLGDEDVSPRRPGTKRRTPHVGSESSSVDEKVESSATSGKSLGKKTQRISRNIAEKNQLEEDFGWEDVQPKKRKFVKGVRPSSPEEDEDDILDEIDEHRELLFIIIFVLVCNNEP